MMGTEGSKVPSGPFWLFFFSFLSFFLSCPTSQLFLLSVEICTVCKQMLGPVFTQNFCNSSTPGVLVLSSLLVRACSPHHTVLV